MNITDEMVKAYRLAELRAETAGESINAAMRAGLEAVAPLIAAQELRLAAEELAADGETVAGWLQVRAAALAPCPTCAGPTRETVGMVCQTCGTDYAPGS